MSVVVDSIRNISSKGHVFGEQTDENLPLLTGVFKKVAKNIVFLITMP